MNFLDIILLIPMIWFLYRGFTKGFIIELASLIALIAGIWVAIHFSFYVGDFLAKHMDISEKYLGIISFIVTFLIVVIVVIIIGKIVERFVDLIALGFLNKLAGAVFGVLKAAFIMSIIIFIINSFDEDSSIITPKMREGSLLYKPVESLFPMIIPRINLDTWDGIRDNEQDII